MVPSWSKQAVLALIGVALIAPWDRTGVTMEDIMLRHNVSANSRQRDRITRRWVSVRLCSKRDAFECVPPDHTPPDSPTTTRLVPIICGQEEIPIPAGHKTLFGPVDKPVRRESANLAIALKTITNTKA